LRISTNVINREGKRAVGTSIGFDSPVVKAIENGERYVGRAFVVDSWYVTAYEPIYLDGEIQGILYVGIPEIDYTALSEYFKTKKYFGSGYPYIVDGNGILTAHPNAVGVDLSGYDFFKEMNEKKNGRVTYLWEGREKTQYFQYLEEIDSYITVGWYSEDYEAIFSEIRLIMIVATILGLLAVLVMLFIIVRSVMKQLGADPLEVQKIANKVSEGDFDININLVENDNSSLLYSMNTMVGTIKEMLGDTQKLTEAASDGKLDVRADSDKFKGEYGNLVSGFNNTLDSIIGPLNVAAEYIDRISKGDIPPKITEEYKGDFNEIKNNLNLCIDSLSVLVDEIGVLIKASSNGHLDVRADSSKSTGVYRKLLRGINDTLDSLIHPLNVAAEYVDRISKGDVPPVIVDEYKGDFNEIKNNINVLIDATSNAANIAVEISKGNLNNEIRVRSSDDKLMLALQTMTDALKELISDTSGLVEAATKEEFGTRADADKHSGDFRKIISGINQTLDVVVDKIFWFEALLDSIPTPISVTDMDMNWTFINKAAEQVAGTKRKEVIGMHCSNWKADICGTEKCGITCMRNGEPTSFFTQPGLDMDFRVDTSYITNKNGDTIGHIEVVTDVTETSKKAAYNKVEIARLATNLQKIAAGSLDLDTNLSAPDKYTQADFNNFTNIYENLAIVQNSIINLISDTTMLAKAATEGKLDTRADVSKHQGEYRSIVEGVNRTLDSVICPLNVAAEYVDRISKGDMPPKITDDYRGDFNEIKNNINQCIDSIKMLISEANKLSIAAKEGRLDIRADLALHSGDFREIIRGVNTTLDNFVGMINQIPGMLYRCKNDSDYTMVFVSRGAIDVTGYSNDIIKNKIGGVNYSGMVHKNDSERLDNAISDAIQYKKEFNVNYRIIDKYGKVKWVWEQGHGIFDEHGNLTALEGYVSDVNEQKLLEEKVKKSADYQAKNVEMINQNLLKIAKGDLNLDVEIMPADEDIKEIQKVFELMANALDNTKISLKRLISDAEMLSISAIEGKLSVRADASLHHGDYRKIIEGVNNTLNAVVNPLRAAADTVYKISIGNIPEQITASYNGEFNDIKNNLNQCINSVNMLVSDAGKRCKYACRKCNSWQFRSKSRCDNAPRRFPQNRGRVQQYFERND